MGGILGMKHGLWGLPVDECYYPALDVAVDSYDLAPGSYWAGAVERVELRIDFEDWPWESLIEADGDP